MYRSLSFLVLLVSTVASASAGSGEPHVNWWKWDVHAPPIGWYVLDFVIFCLVLRVVVRKFVLPALAKRHFALKREIAAASETKEDAKAHRDAYEQKRKHVSEEAEQLKASASDDGAAMRDHTLEHAGVTAARMIADVDTIIAQDLKATQRDLSRITANQVVDEAETRLRTGMNDADRVRMFEASLLQIESGAIDAERGGQP